MLNSCLIPSICVTPASPVEVHPDPYSPFPSRNLHTEDDAYRANWLSLPPLPPWQSSSLAPANRPARQGLAQDQFASLLKVSREQGAKSRSQTDPNLRKQLALRSQAVKQLERRARFLSKVNGPSCVSPIPGDSPSPCGFRSEHLTLEIAAESSEDTGAHNPAWDNLAERGSLPAPTRSDISPAGTVSRRIPPSLEEITAHLRPVPVSSNRKCSLSPPNSPRTSSLSAEYTDRPNKALVLNSATFNAVFTHQVIRPGCRDPSKMGARDTVVSHTIGVAAKSALRGSRADTARDMIMTLMRRSSPPLGRVPGKWHRSEGMRLIAT